MDRQQVLVLLLSVLLSLITGYMAGLNHGILLSALDGPVGACEKLRFPFYVCSSLE